MGQARFYLERLGEDFDRYEDEDRLYKAALTHGMEALAKLGRVQMLERQYLPTYQFDAEDIVVVMGQDGLVANTLKYLQEQPVIAVNPMPDYYDGVLLPFGVEQLTAVAKAALANRVTCKPVSMAEVQTNVGQSLLAVNDLFIGCKSHSSATYQLQVGKQREAHSSSGVIVSTGLGSTGWLRSVLTGSAAIAGQTTQRSMIEEGFDWSARALYFAVREPFPSHNTGTSLVFGKLTEQKPLKLTSTMSDNGVIFSDGMEQDAINFNAGITATVRLAAKSGQLVH